MKTIVYHFVLMIIVVFTASNLVFAQWTQLADMPTARTCLSVETVNGKIYAIGGIDGPSPINAVEEYDPMTDTWVRKKRMPTNRGYFSSSVVNGEIYSIGGYNPSTKATVEKYNPITDTWTEKAPLNIRRWGHGSCTVNGKIYAIGGAYGWPGTHKSSVEEYDPTADSWTNKTSMPTKRWMLSCSVVNGKIYAIGGCGVSNIGTSAVEEYDPATDTWTTKSPMPTARYGLTTGVVNGKIYAIGGGDKDPPNKCYKLVEVYDPATDTWSNMDPMPVGRLGCSSASVDNRICVIGGGGVSASEIYREVYVLELATKMEDSILKPDKFHLYQNYPNPFNPSTVISYKLPSSVKGEKSKVKNITLKVYDILGREVATLVNEQQNPGFYEVTWNASNNSSGIYFYKLEAGSFIETKNMVLIR
ncbi:MAG: kelch repeat-containing protein [Bacteroidota bacterium]